MNSFHKYINIAGGHLLDLSEPLVMGILNCTPDSFYAGSRSQTEEAIARRARAIIDEGGSIIDIGACSTRPDSDFADETEETERLRMALPIIRRECPEAVLSVDTFRPNVARMAVEEYGVSIVNDISGGCEEMYRAVARMGVPYILTSQKADTQAIILDLTEKIRILRSIGQKDIIIDPGFGFGKTLEDNYAVMRDLDVLHALGLPILVGISRKSMIYKALDITQDEALTGTICLNSFALAKGCHILRVHDVREAADTVRMHKILFNK